MRSYVFTDRERNILKKFLINTEVGKTEVSKIIQHIKKNKNLFEDIFLYLQVRKTITT